MNQDKNKFNSIPNRIKNIKELINENVIDSMIGEDNTDSTSNSNDDIREYLPKKYLDFNTAINSLGGKLLYIKSGASGHTFKGVNYNKKNKCDYAVKIVAYPKKDYYGDMFDIKRPENTELVMIKILSWFVKNNQTPHIVLPITTFNTSIKPFINLPKDDIVNNKRFDEFVQKYYKGHYYDNVSILVSEWANAGDLLDYLKKNYQKLKLKDWKVLFFQILSVLAIVQTKYPGFRHNDLKANNVLVNKIGVSTKSKNFLYKINKKKYVVPNIGLQIKLWDYDFACIPGLVENKKVDSDWTTKINVNPEQNRYYDVHYFFNTLTKKGFLPEFWTDDNVPDKVKKFVKRLLPDEVTQGKNVTDRGRILSKKEYFIPDDILRNDEFFRAMRID
jgi:serine/threonine protein kinase